MNQIYTKRLHEMKKTMKKTLTLTAVFIMLFLNILYAQNTDSVAVK